jgi:hypothetical protein
MSGYGTNAKCRLGPEMSAYRGGPEVIGARQNDANDRSRLAARTMPNGIFGISFL